MITLDRAVFTFGVVCLLAAAAYIHLAGIPV